MKNTLENGVKSWYMVNPLENLIRIIKIGSRTEVKEAQKQVEKFWHNFYIPHREEGKKVFTIFLDEIEKLEEIKDIDHQAYFINTLKWPLWAIGEEYFEKWAEFILKYIEHSSGKIRQAIINTSDYLIIGIMVDLRHENGGDKKLISELRERVENNKIRFGFLVLAAENLLKKYHEPKFERYKYVSSMPSGIYKSIQKLLTEKLLRSEYYENLYKGFLSKINHGHSQFRSQLTADQILEKRKEIEKELLEMLKKTKSDFGLDDIREVIYNEEGQDALTDIIAMFDTGQGLIELENILETVNDAWNYFPHKIIGGISPAEKLLEYHQKQK